MTKVAMIYSVPVTQTDGASRVVQSFVANKELFLANGIEIDLFAPQEKCDFIQDNNHHIYQFLKRVIFRIDIAGIIRTLFDLVIRGKKAVNLYNAPKGQYDVVMFHEPAACYNYIKRKGSEKTILVLHSVGGFFSTSLIEFPLLKYTLFNNLYLAYIRKTLLKKVDLIVFNSELSSNNFYQTYKSARKDLATYVDNGIVDFESPDRHLEHPDDKYRLVCIGNVVERKGQTFIVDAISEMNEKELEHIHVCFVGDGKSRQELEKRVRDNGLDKYISFSGVQKDVIPFLDRANIFILPSLVEGMPISIIEAMRSALPIISTHVGGIPYQVQEGYNGILIEASKEGVKKALRELGNYNWKEMGLNSRKRYLEKFSLDQTIAKYSTLINNLCEYSMR